MNLLELRNSLTQKDFSSLYIFYGKEYTILELYIQKIMTTYTIRPSFIQIEVVTHYTTKYLLADGMGAPKAFLPIRRSDGENIQTPERLIIERQIHITHTGEEKHIEVNLSIRWFMTNCQLQKKHISMTSSKK